MTTFKQEVRYYVVKIKDCHKYLTYDEQYELRRLLAIVDKSRCQTPLRCVVVEEDWPEYEPI